MHKKNYRPLRTIIDDVDCFVAQEVTGCYNTITMLTIWVYDYVMENCKALTLYFSVQHDILEYC